MKSTQAFDRVTGGRPLSAKTHEWIADLADRFGDETTAAAIEAEGPGGSFDKLLGRVRDRLAKQQLIERRGEPTQLTGQQVLAIARGEASEPEPPYVVDTRDLTKVEYAEVLAWRDRRPGGGLNP
jgi:hypothetical protein